MTLETLSIADYYLICDSINRAGEDRNRIPYLRNVMDYLEEHYHFKAWRKYNHIAQQLIVIDQLERDLEDIDNSFIVHSEGTR